MTRETYLTASYSMPARSGKDIYCGGGIEKSGVAATPSGTTPAVRGAVLSQSAVKQRAMDLRGP